MKSAIMGIEVESRKIVFRLTSVDLLYTFFPECRIGKKDLRLVIIGSRKILAANNSGRVVYDIHPVPGDASVDSGTAFYPTPA
jgi:hypothetical protein